jgi:hypothetical protein
MLAASPMLGTHPHFEAMRTCSVAVTAAWTACAPIMYSQLNFAERALCFDYRRDSSLELTAQGLVNWLRV